MRHTAGRSLCPLLFLLVAKTLSASSLEEQLTLAEDNVGQLRQALDAVAEDERAGMEFLIANMSERDLRTLSSDYLLENVRLAYRAWRDAPWHAQVSESLFLNNVLPYASIKRTPLRFPCVWNRHVDYVSAVNVTGRYADERPELPTGHGYARFRVVNAAGNRVSRELKLADAQGQVCFEGATRDERFDGNDHLTAVLAKGDQFTAIVDHEGQQVTKLVTLDEDEQLFTVKVAHAKEVAADDPLVELESFLSRPPDQRGEITAQAFFSIPLTKQQAEKAIALLWADHVAANQAGATGRNGSRCNRGRRLEDAIFLCHFRRQAERRRSLYISMHGGGGAPKQVNDQQWKNQQQLYEPPEGIYLAPRAPTDAWNLWHQAHIDRLFDRLIENLVVLEDVNPNRVYLMGYSAGGDGAYQLAPRMADRWAAVSMMAGHPNDTSPLGLRNIGFAIFMGGRDAAYKRNEVAAEWKEQLAALHQEDPEGYRHQVTIYSDKGHWMDGEDASSIDWMRIQERRTLPEKVVWKQDDVIHHRFYWLATESPKAGTLIEAERDGPTIDLRTEDVASLSIRLNDDMVDLDQPVRVTSGTRVLHDGVVARTIATLYKTLAERGDPASVFSGELHVSLR